MEMQVLIYSDRVKVSMTVLSIDIFAVAKMAAPAGQAAAALGCPVLTSMSTVGNDLTIWFGPK